MTMLKRSRAAIAAIVIVISPNELRGQAPRTVTTVVQVRDSAQRPIGGADLALARNDSEPVAFGRTSEQGRYEFTIPSSESTLTLSVRHIGYSPRTEKVVIGAIGTVSLEVTLKAVDAGLDTVRVLAQQLPHARQPFVGSNEIARDTRAIFTLADVLHKLRPKIGYQSHRCPTTPVRLKGPTVAPPRVYVNGTWVPDAFSPMSRVHAEHIASVMYVNCLDHSIPGLPSRPWPSVYVALKAGVAWDLKNGTRVVDSASFAASEPKPPN